MEKLIISSIGPIKKISIDLGKINVLIGPQSSGKSIIAKILSFCQWVEKRYFLDRSFKYSAIEELLNYHHLGPAFFSDESSFYYESNYLKIEYKGKALNRIITQKERSNEYKVTKNIYIPSERNFVSAIPNLSKYKENNDNVMSFVYDWYSAKRHYNKNNCLKVLDLGVSYYNDEEPDNDMLTISNNNLEFQLNEGSSGLQSLVPMLIMVDYLSLEIENKGRISSVSEQDNMLKMISTAMNELFSKKRIKELSKDVGTDDFNLSNTEVDQLLQFINRRTTYSCSKFIIEEPEQNLFPQTQSDLVYYLINRMKINSGHFLFLTTHSPYILYALNNCLLAGILKDKVPTEVRRELKCYKSAISPEDVNVWEMVGSTGGLKKINNSDLKTINDHYFNTIMSEILDEYYTLLSYLDEGQVNKSAAKS